MVRPADCWGFGNYRAAVAGVFDLRNCSRTQVLTSPGRVLEAQRLYEVHVAAQRHGTKSSRDSTAWSPATSEHVYISSNGVSRGERRDLDFGLVVMRLGFVQGVETLPRGTYVADTVYSQP